LKDFAEPFLTTVRYRPGMASTYPETKPFGSTATSLSIGDCVGFGWETFKKRPGILIGALLLTIIVPAIPGMVFPGPELVPGEPPPLPSAASSIASLIGVVLGILAHLGAITLALRAHDNVETVEIGDLWNPQAFWRFLGAEILLGIIVFAGFLLLVVPGVIAALGLGFAPYLVVDRGMGPIEALKQSWHLTKGYKWPLLGLALALVGLNLLGVAALIVGLLVTVPISWLAVTHAFRTMQARAAT
jgi:Protein of unknown function (DUF975)